MLGLTLITVRSSKGSISRVRVRLTLTAVKLIVSADADEFIRGGMFFFGWVWAFIL